MTRDEVIRLARGAGLPLAWVSAKGVVQWAQLERFAALVAAQERSRMCEQCLSQQEHQHEKAKGDAPY